MGLMRTCHWHHKTAERVMPLSFWILVLLGRSIAFFVQSPFTTTRCKPTPARGYHGSPPFWLSATDEEVLEVTDNHNETGGELRKNNAAAVQLVTCTSSRELTRAIQTFVRPNDTVAELGSQLRDVSIAICQMLDHRGRAVLVDVQRKFPKSKRDDGDAGRTRAMRRQGDEIGFFPKVATFLEIPTLNDWRRALFFLNKAMSQHGGYSVLVLDVSAIVGNDLELTSLSMVQDFLGINEAVATGGQQCCRVVLIKSIGLNSLASRLFHAQRWIKQQGADAAAPSRTVVIASVGVQEYRQTIPYSVQPGDAVLEIGCHLGTTTAILHEQASAGTDHNKSIGYCIGVDVGASIVKGARKRHPHVFFEVGDAWRTADLLRIQQDFIRERTNSNTTSTTRRGFDVVYVDVGGLSGSDGLLEALSLLSAIEHALEPRCIVIKSLCMTRLSSQLTSFWEIHKRQRKRRWH